MNEQAKQPQESTEKSTAGQFAEAEQELWASRIIEGSGGGTVELYQGVGEDDTLSSQWRVRVLKADGSEAQVWTGLSWKDAADRYSHPFAYGAADVFGSAGS